MVRDGTKRDVRQRGEEYQRSADESKRETARRVGRTFRDSRNRRFSGAEGSKLTATLSQAARAGGAESREIKNAETMPRRAKSWLAWPSEASLETSCLVAGDAGSLRIIGGC
jgi:hypothetical protein